MNIELNQLFKSFPSLGKIYEAASKNKGDSIETMKQFKKGELTPFLISVMEMFCNLFDPLNDDLHADGRIKNSKSLSSSKRKLRTKRSLEIKKPKIKRSSKRKFRTKRSLEIKKPKIKRSSKSKRKS